MRVRQTYWSPIGWLDKLTTIYLPWDSLALVGAAAIIGWGNKLFSILLLVVKSLSCGTTLILLFSWLNNYLDYLSIGSNSVSFILAICTVKDWDQTTGIIGVSLSGYRTEESASWRCIGVGVSCVKLSCRRRLLASRWHLLLSHTRHGQNVVPRLNTWLWGILDLSSSPGVGWV